MNARALAKDVLGRLATAPGAAAGARRRLRSRTNVVYYHYVGPPVPWYAAFGSVSPERLDADLRLLSRWFSFAPLDGVAAGTAPAVDGRPPVAITFDDGFDLAAAEPVLARHGVRATAFVITSCLDNRQLMWRNKLSAVQAERPADVQRRAYDAAAAEHGLAPLGERGLIGASRNWPMDRKDELADAVWQAAEMPPLAEYLERHRPYFTWEGLRRWQTLGHDVGLHTATHPDCSQIAADAVEAEIVEPATLLRRELGLGSVALSYPFGCRLDREIERRLVGDGVISHAYGVDGLSPRRTPPHRLDRACGEKALRYHVFARTLMAEPEAARR